VSEKSESSVAVINHQAAFRNLNEVVLDRSDLETIVFTNKLLLQIASNVTEANCDQVAKEQVSEAIDRATNALSDVIGRHQIELREINRKILDFFKNVKLQFVNNSNLENVVSPALGSLLSCVPDTAHTGSLTCNQSSFSDDDGLAIDLAAQGGGV
jgi:hypothetical protein